MPQSFSCAEKKTQKKEPLSAKSVLRKLDIQIKRQLYKILNYKMNMLTLTDATHKKGRSSNKDGS